VSDTRPTHRPLLIAAVALVGLTTVALVLVLVFARPVAHHLAARRNTPPAATNSPPSAPGEILATRLFIAADDFVVDVFHNGQRVPYTARQMTTEVYGAIGERVDITVRERDWVVFNVVNNRLRWGGAYYFGVAGENDDSWVGISSEENEQWSVCEDPGLVPRFIAEPDFLATNYAQRIAEPWKGGDAMIRKHVKNWAGEPIWGSPANRNIWIKFNAKEIGAGRRR
jgi:hypothetical protein